MIKKLSTGERRCQQTNVTERVRSDELARLDHDKGDVAHLLVFLLRMALEEFERFLFAYVASFHEYALGPLDEFSRLDGLAHLRKVFPEFRELRALHPVVLYGLCKIICYLRINKIQ